MPMTNNDLEEEVLSMLNTLEDVALKLNKRGLEHLTNRGPLVKAWSSLRELRASMGEEKNAPKWLTL